MSKKFVPTDEQRRNVEAMIGFGIKEAEICRLIWNSETGKPIDEKTLRLHFEHEIDSGQVKANAQVAGSLFKDATDRGEGTNPSARVHAACYWLARRAGWKETNKVELTGEDGDPIKVEHARERIVARVAELHEKLRGGETGVATTNGSGRHPGEPE